MFIGALFPPTGPPTARRPIGWRAVALGAGALLAGAGVSLARQPGAGALDTVWAEDGTVFLTEAARSGAVDSVTTSYAGYYHLIPRLIAELVALAPAPAASTLLAVAAALATGGFAVLVYVASADHLATRLGRLLAAGIVVVLPLGQSDLPNSIANIHWPGLYALFWMLLWTPRGRVGQVLAVAVVFLVGASDILTVLFLPLALARVWLRRTRYALVLSGALGLAVAVQLGGLFFGSATRERVYDPVTAASGYLVRAVPSGLIGERWLGSDVDTRWLALAGVAWLLVLAALVVAWRRLTRPAWALAVTAALFSVLLYTVPVFLSGVATPRYAAAPVMLLVVALAALLQPVPGGGRHAPAGAWRGPASVGGAALYLLAALLAVVCAVNLRTDNARADGPQWSGELDRAKLMCAKGTPTGTVEIPVAPADPPWLAAVPCRWVNR